MVSFFRTMSEVQKLEVFALQGKKIAANKQKKEGKLAEFYYSMFIKTIQDFWERESAISKKSDLTEEELKILSDQRIAAFRQKRKRGRHGAVADSIQVRFEEIRYLRAQGLSWRDTAAYLRKHSKFKVNHSYLAQQFKKIEREMRIDNNEA